MQEFDEIFSDTLLFYNFEIDCETLIQKLYSIRTKSQEIVTIKKKTSWLFKEITIYI